MKFRHLQLVLAFSLLFGGVLVIAAAGVRAVFDLDSGGLFATSGNGGVSKLTLLILLSGGAGLVAGIWMLVTENKNTPG